MTKNWLKRTLVGAAACAALAASIAAYSEANDGPGWHRAPPSAEEMAAHEARMLARIGKSLDLDANQAAKLKILADTLQAQRPKPPAPGTAGPRERMQALIAGPTFDRAGALQILNEKLAKLQTAGPALITAAGNFFDSLNPTQQQKVRDFAARHHGFEGFGGPREHGGPHEHGGHGPDDPHGPIDSGDQPAPPPPGH